MCNMRARSKIGKNKPISTNASCIQRSCHLVILTKFHWFDRYNNVVPYSLMFNIILSFIHNDSFHIHTFSNRRVNLHQFMNVRIRV